MPRQANAEKMHWAGENTIAHHGEASKLIHLEAAHRYNKAALFLRHSRSTHHRFRSHHEDIYLDFIISRAIARHTISRPYQSEVNGTEYVFMKSIIRSEAWLITSHQVHIVNAGDAESTMFKNKSMAESWYQLSWLGAPGEGWRHIIRRQHFSIAKGVSWAFQYHGGALSS